MNRQKLSSLESPKCPAQLATLTQAIPPGRRGAILQSAASFQPNATLHESFAVGPIRAAFADFWEARFGEPVPFKRLRAVLEPPVPIATVLEFSKLMLARDEAELEDALAELVDYLHSRVRQVNGTIQRSLFDVPNEPASSKEPRSTFLGSSVSSLNQLLDQGKQFSTIYADPPWPYDNKASRAAAENHYPTMALDAICAEPVQQLVEANAHLHLWTTNSFLHEAFDVIDAWGFCFKSCLVWVKDEIGMGNYCGVSHEFSLLGVRGNLTFKNRKARSWIQAQRTAHSRKPRVVRALVESVSPGPYLELYGREELPNSEWTVYGNQVEKRLF